MPKRLDLRQHKEAIVMVIALLAFPWLLMAAVVATLLTAGPPIAILGANP